ncbi:MAG: MBL fold metallo-hydrolase [Treponema sp.]|nr:MBL fold metallo-hydrolase [Treponema sp.]
MDIQFWGVRGSLPTPLTPQQIQSKIIAAVQRITPADIESTESREKFISSLPEWIFGTTGGNTPCVVINCGDTKVILDCGTGVRVYGKAENRPDNDNFNYHILLSHFHWDHIQGLPFFDPAYMPKSKIDFYSPFPAAKKLLQNQMKRPYYPVPFESFTKDFNFHTIRRGEEFKIGDMTVNFCKMSHPGNSYSYAFTDPESKKKFVYATDVELKSQDFEENEQTIKVFKDADVIVLDSQYTVEEAYKKVNWGHSAFCYAIDFAVHWNIKELYLFHHEPTYDDKKLSSILQAARWYAQYIDHADIKIHLAKESKKIHL